MLAPIITKDMKLFPSRPLPAKIKNVRSRAQSLDDLKNRSLARSNLTPVRHRSSQSVGHLPTASRSSPKASLAVRKPITLDAIVEGVEMSSNKGSSKKGTPSNKLAATSSAYAQVCSSPDLEGMTTDSTSSLSTSSAPVLEKHSSSGPKTIVKWITNSLKSKSKEECSNENGKIRGVTACS
uniref:Ovule protein n=1 Tax=Ascaris lumbricoides TaxID=6252 RepID=A0A0M3HP08_ASCLU